MKRVVALLVLFTTIFISLPLLSAIADIPSNVKNEYKYGTSDKSIITVKERLQELGYFSSTASFSASIGSSLKEAVKEFQKNNNLKDDGKLNKKLFAILFSDNAIKKDGTKANNDLLPLLNNTTTNKPSVKNIKTTNAPTKNTSIPLIQEKSSHSETTTNNVPTYLTYVILSIILALIIACYINIKHKKVNYRQCCSESFDNLITYIHKDDMSNNEFFHHLIALIDYGVFCGAINIIDISTNKKSLPKYIKEIQPEITKEMPSEIIGYLSNDSKSLTNKCSFLDFYIHILRTHKTIYQKKSKPMIWKCIYKKKDWKIARKLLLQKENDIRNEVKDDKVKELKSLLHAFIQLKSKDKIVKAILNSFELLNDLSLLGIEAFAIPIDEDDKYKYINPQIIDEAKNAFPDNPYYTLDNIVRKDLNSEEEKWLIDSHILIWNNLRSNKIDSALIMNHINRYEPYYTKIKYLYESLVSYELIVDNEINRYAFRFLVWYLWYNTIKDYVNSFFTDDEKQQISNNIGYRAIVKRLYDNGHPAFSITYLLSSAKYIYGETTLFINVYNDVSNQVENIIKEIEKKQYVDILLDNSRSHESKKYTIIDTYNMNPYDFEELIAKVFCVMGYNAFTTKKSGDQGVDVIAKKGISTIAIQTKCYPNTVVGNSAIQEVVAGMSFYKATESYVITNSSFTKSAIELASANNVTLWDKDVLTKMLDRYPVRM